MLSRRTFLLGGAATVGLAATGVGVGVEVVGTDRILHELGLRSSPDRRVPPSGWDVVEASFRSGHMGRRVGWAMSLPPGDEPVLGAVVCLHGKGGNRRRAFDSIHLHDVVADSGERIAVVGVDGGTGSYWHARDDGTDAGRMVLDELVPLVRQQAGIRRLAIMGWSMGGYGALLLAEQSPETFAAVVSSSGALWERAEDTAPGAFDDADDFAAHDVFAMSDRLDVTKTRIDCGAGDPFIPGNRALVERLGPGVASSFPPGYHDPAFWRYVAPRQVAFIADRLRAAPLVSTRYPPG
jgi:enterochelin esterase-like enzyme